MPGLWCAGEEPPAEDVQVPTCISTAEADGTLAALYVVDFVHHFTRQLGCAAPPWQDAHALLTGVHAGQGVAVLSEVYQPLWDLYQGLLRFLLAVRCWTRLNCWLYRDLA